MLDSLDDDVCEQDGIRQNGHDAVDDSHDDDCERLKSGRWGEPGA